MFRLVKVCDPTYIPTVQEAIRWEKMFADELPSEETLTRENITVEIFDLAPDEKIVLEIGNKSYIPNERELRDFNRTMKWGLKEKDFVLITHRAVKVIKIGETK